MTKFTINPDLSDYDAYRRMSRWFSPRLLLDIVQRVFESTLFGQFADRRLVHAALDPLTPENLSKRCGIEDGICRSEDGVTWVDYVADLGDGFESTYLIAYLMAQKELQVEGQLLPRADCLVMGGDEVYPNATPDNYKSRLQNPYEAAFPRTEVTGADHPPVFMIPGNHDWYDGLTQFLGKFCRGRDTHLGSWNAKQARSYFAIHLQQDWWIWGFDSQLGDDIDKPQADYFAEVARLMKPGSKIILCGPEPTWRMGDAQRNTREERRIFERGFDYISNIAGNECKDVQIVLGLSGDLHHYSRYNAKPSGVNFIGAGGGGAFLHPTHGLPDTINMTWMNSVQHLKMATKTVSGNQTDVCYPSREISKKLALGNWKFALSNLDFGPTLGVLYFVAAILMLWWNGYGGGNSSEGLLQRIWHQLQAFALTPVSVLAILAIGVVLHRYADFRSSARKWIFATIHAIAHIILLFFATALVTALLLPVKSYPVGEILYFVGLAVGMVLAGVVGGVIWGLYLLISSYFYGDHPNDAFSAMRLDSYRHFLRIKIESDQITIFPVGVDRTPRRNEWQKNPQYREGQQDGSYFSPIAPIAVHFIEHPIVVLVADIKSAQGMPTN